MTYSYSHECPCHTSKLSHTTTTELASYPNKDYRFKCCHDDMLSQLQMYHLQNSNEDNYCNQEYNDDSSDDRHSHSDDILTSSITGLAFRFIVGVKCHHIQLATNSCSSIVTICYPSLQK